MSTSLLSRFRAERTYAHGTLQVSDATARERLAFFGLSADDLGVLATWKPAAEQHMDALIDAFYAHVLANTTTRAVLQQHTTVDRQRNLLAPYVRNMFAGIVDDRYVQHRRKVGGIHDDIELEASWFVGMYEVIRREGIRAVEIAGATPKELRRFTDAFTRLLNVDIALVISALTESRRDKINALHVNDVRAERDAAVRFLDEADQVLGALARNDLTARMRGEYTGRFAQLAGAINTATDQLRDTLHNVSRATRELAFAVGQIQTTSADLARGASDQASAIEEVTASLGELTSTAQSNARDSEQARTRARSLQQEADAGTTRMQHLAVTMQEIETSASQTARIVRTIDEIAFQTNLLALNAAVEAARAGDAGRGFAVVAEEVRALAIRSAEAARQTAALIDTSVHHVGAGVALNREVAQDFERISSQLGAVSVLMDGIAAVSADQADGIRQIAAGTEQVNNVTQQVAAGSEELAATAGELDAQAASLEDQVGQFVLGDRNRRARTEVHEAREESFDIMPTPSHERPRSGGCPVSGLRR